MSEKTVLVRDRKTRRIVGLRVRPKPIKVRVCRACSRVHTPAGVPCRAA